jgi:hypothetical protein
MSSPFVTPTLVRGTPSRGPPSGTPTGTHRETNDQGKKMRRVQLLADFVPTQTGKKNYYFQKTPSKTNIAKVGAPEGQLGTANKIRWKNEKVLEIQNEVSQWRALRVYRARHTHVLL